jgi:hypothetical protein
MKNTKFWLAVGIIGAFLFVLVLLAVKARLDAVLAGILVGGVTGVKGLFDAANTANNKAALAAGKGLNEEAARIALAAPVDVLAAAGAATGTDIAGVIGARADGAVGDLRGGVERARAEVSRAAQEGRDRLRAAASDLSGGSGG